MRLSKIICAVSLFALCMIGIASCSGGGRLESEIREAFVSGDTTEARFAALCKIAASDPRRYSDFVDQQGNVNVAALAKYINEIGSTLRPPMTWNVSAYGLKPLSLSVYFERSGSMTPYDAPGGRGQLKKAVNDIINHFPQGGKVTLNIVNDGIYPYRGTVEEFVKDRDIYASTRDVGNASYTDFELILNKIFQNQGRDEVSILVTDLIYSPKGAEDVSAQKIFNEENSLATAVFRKHSGKGVIVHRFVGDYNGKYYPFRGSAVDYSGQRPFFVLVLADNAVLDRMAAGKGYEALLTPEGATHTYRFNQPEQQVPFAVVPDWKDDAGRYRLSHDDAATLNKCEGDRTTGKMCFTIAADLSKLHKSPDFLNTAGNYKVASQGGYTLAVRPISQADITTNNKVYLEGKTHLLTFTGKPAAGRDQVVVTLPNELPDWLQSLSSDDDTSTSASGFANTTFGMSHFLKGIADAFPAGGNYAKITLSINP